MTVPFRKHEEWFSFRDSQGNPIERKTEIRFDPLTGETSRLIFDSGAPMPLPDYEEVAKQTGGAKCPFCSENILKITPEFPERIAEEGRIVQGHAIVFPNLFPYGKHNSVVIFSDQKHYIPLNEFTDSMIKDAFMAAQTYIQKVAEVDVEARHASINWNYLPFSGGSVLHPHIQVVS